MIKLSKNMTLEKLDKQRESFLPNAGNFLAFFIIFEWGRIFVIAIDKQENKCNAKLRPNCFFVNVSVVATGFC